MVFHRYSEHLISTIVILLTFCTWRCAAYLCHQTDALKGKCSCQFDDPTKKVIDFSPISRTDGQPEFPFDGYGTTVPEWTYAFNPCSKFDGPGVCKESSVCQQSKSNPETVFNLGDPAPTTWTPEDENTTKVTYASTDGRTSVVSFTCDKTAVTKPILTFGVELPPKTYNFVVKTCHACLETVPGCIKTGSSLTTGGVLCIIFTVLVVVYFVGGILFQKFGRGATGIELIPNYGFWSDFPILVKDGFLFMISPCTKDEGYSSI